MLRCCVAGGFSGILGASGMAACVNPKSDYQDYLDRTASVRSNTGSSSGGEAFDGTLSDAGFNQQYVMVCGAQLVGDNVAQATYFVATLQFTAAPSGGGTLDFTDQVLVKGATDITQTAGAVANVNNVPVTPQGTADVSFGPTVIPGSADPVENGVEIDFADSTLHFIIQSSTQICAALGGDITAPISQPSLDPSKNPCIYIPYSGGPIPRPTQDQLHCP